MVMFINPGSGPVADATLESALVNVRAFIADLGDGAAFNEASAKDCGDGRWEFTVRGGDGSYHKVEMPGAPLDRVRFVDSTEQNIWDFPRLYVNGSSWVWCYALGACEKDDE